MTKKISAERFLLDHPYWAGLPSEVVEKSFSYASWAFSTALLNLWFALTRRFWKDWKDTP